MDKSYSETNLDEISILKTPTSYISQRPKRRREELTDSDYSIFKNEIKAMITSFMSNQESELKKITPALKEIQTTILNIENSMAFLSNQNEELKQKITKLENEAKKDKEHIIMLEEKIEDLDRNSQKCSIEIKNVPKKANENKTDLMNYVQNLANTIKIDINTTDIKDIYRVKVKNEAKTSPIIVETSSTITKTNVLKGVKAFNIKNKEKLRAKHLGYTTQEDTPIYVAEKLTAKGSRLFYLTRELSKSKNYMFCWTSFGRIYVREKENSPILLIKSEGQVNQLMQKI